MERKDYEKLLSDIRGRLLYSEDTIVFPYTTQDGLYITKHTWGSTYCGITTGITSLDEFLEVGLPTGKITHFYGPAGFEFALRLCKQYMKGDILIFKTIGDLISYTSNLDVAIVIGSDFDVGDIAKLAVHAKDKRLAVVCITDGDPKLIDIKFNARVRLYCEKHDTDLYKVTFTKINMNANQGVTVIVDLGKGSCVRRDALLEDIPDDEDSLEEFMNDQK